MMYRIETAVCNECGSESEHSSAVATANDPITTVLTCPNCRYRGGGRTTTNMRRVSIRHVDNVAAGYVSQEYGHASVSAEPKPTPPEWLREWEQERAAIAEKQAATMADPDSPANRYITRKYGGK